MREWFDLIFADMKIEYYAVLSYSDCRETGENIIKRANLTPRSVIIYLVPYYTGECENISRYAASLDYHLVIKEINEAIARALSEKFPEAKIIGYGDHSPIDERYAALISGLGIAGESGLLINEKYGTYVFIGDVITDIPPEKLGAISPREISRCDSCGLCKAVCPTGILRGEGCECLSAITQKKGELSEEEASLMREYNTAWGCDECQSACPHNSNPEKTPLEFFYRDRIENLTKERLDGMDKDTFSMRAFAWRGRKTVERNLAILENEEEKITK